MNPKDFILFNTTGAQPYTKATIVKPVENCNGFFITNTGDAIATVNGHVLYPGTIGTNNGDSITIGGNAGEIYAGVVSIFFGAGATPMVTIEQKFYLPVNKHI